MKASVAKWGNSLGIRIPASLAALLRIEDGGCVELTVHEGSLVLTPVQELLPDLLRLVTPASAHTESAWGEPQGKETW